MHSFWVHMHAFPQQSTQKPRPPFVIAQPKAKGGGVSLLSVTRHANLVALPQCWKLWVIKRS